MPDSHVFTAYRSMGKSITHGIVISTGAEGEVERSGRRNAPAERKPDSSTALHLGCG